MSFRTAFAVLLSASVLPILLIDREPLGTRVLDRVHGVEAQDEAVYSHAAIRMAETGDWMSPYFLDRLFLYKPPLIYWLSGASVKILGVSSWALRLPSCLAGAACVFMMLVWAGTINPRSWPLAFVALSPWFAYSAVAGRNLTDSLLTLLILGTAWTLYRDPKLDRRLSQATFCAATAAAILLKSTAGLIPLLILGGFKLASREAPPWLRVICVGAVSLAAALPWFYYQYSLHPRWFWTEFVEVELLAYGAGRPTQQAPESVWTFYGSVLWAHFPFLTGFLPLTVASLAKAAWKGDRAARILSVFIAVMTLAILSFSYRNATYLLPLVLALSTSVAFIQNRLAIVLTMAVSILLTALWLGPVPTSKSREAALTVQSYCEAGLRRELIVVNAIEQFHATVLPLQRVRYAFPGGGQPPKGFALDFLSMGIVMPVAEFLDIERRRPRYAAELRLWGLPDDGALASVIAFDGPADLRRLIDASPDRDFLVPNEFATAIEGAPHHVARKESGHRLLMAKRPAEARPPARTCRM